MTDVPKAGVLPQIGYGTWQRKGDEAIRCVRRAIDVGYPLIDTAAMYENEEEVGQAIRDSGRRDDLFVTTKVWFDHLGAGRVRTSAEDSLRRLGLDHVDLLLIHWPSPEHEPLDRYMTELAEVQDAGLTRHIGVSNFTRGHLNAAANAIGAGRIATNQVELNVFFRNRPVVDHCRAMGMPVTAYLPLSKGATENEVLATVAERHGATPAQIALAWLLAEGHVAIPSSSNDDRIAENLKAAEVALTDADMEDLAVLETPERKVNPDFAPEWDSAA